MKKILKFLLSRTFLFGLLIACQVGLFAALMLVFSRAGTVAYIMEGKGLEVVDLGTDVAPETYVQTAVEQGCQIICCSALLTTTMGMMEEVVKKAEEAGIRDKVKIMVGGAPVTEAFCEQIGADKYTADAASAADAAVALCRASA